ncbi:MAG: Hsp20/alpha crystallin family protein [Campylobacterales bacterium]|nr:Hsp20/alpha crystallin family protein [Campylobacterales bacterium]
MLTKVIISSLLAGVTVINAAEYVPNLNSELQRNERIIQEYEKGIQQLKERNKFLQEQKKKNPQLYVTKPLFEETKDAYIQRVKLGGAEAKNINFKIEKHMLSLEMNIKITRDDKDGYYESSRSFYQEYSIPKNVDESKISHSIDGDYFVITMPKK